MLYVANAFSLSMLEGDAILKVRTVPVSDVQKALTNSEFISAVGHESTARIMTRLLGVTVPLNRVSVTLKSGDTAIVFQLLKRLEEGRTLTEEEIASLPFKLIAVTVL